MSKTKYSAALYLRLSKEDGDKLESYSISNQRALGLDFLSRNPDIKLYDEFVDDGYTGSNFNRPRFRELIELITNGKINCVIVKDLSRFAREYIDAGYYLEKLFPAMGIRFISINDNIDYKVDSSNNTKLMIAFKNILNDSYIRDTSIKIRSHLEVKRRNGEYIGAFVVMGYEKSQEDRHKIVVDAEAAKIIKQIFTLRFIGISANAISDKFNLLNIPSPAEYKKIRGSNFKANAQKKHKAKWSAKAVIRILTNEIYTGTLIQGKRTTINYKVKKVIEKDSSEWSIIYDNHEAIIPKMMFDKMQILLKQDTRVKPGNTEPYLFSGFLKCADCGDSLIRRTAKYKDKTYAYYMCSRNKLKLGCTSHRVSEEMIYTAVFSAINTYCRNVASLSERLSDVPMTEIKNAGLDKIRKSQIEKQNEIRDLERTITVVKQRCIDNLENEDICNEICADIQTSIDKLKAEQMLLEKEQNNINLELQRELAWIKVFSDNGEFTELNRSILANIVDEIIVYENKSIVVKFSYRDEYERLLDIDRQINVLEEAV